MYKKTYKIFKMFKFTSRNNNKYKKKILQNKYNNKIALTNLDLLNYLSYKMFNQ